MPRTPRTSLVQKYSDKAIRRESKIGPYWVHHVGVGHPLGKDLLKMYAENEILFPPYVIPSLRDARGPLWRDLVDRVSRLPEEQPENLGFSLLMIRLDGCLNCETDSYRAMRGCLACAQQTLRRFKGSDQELIDRYNKAVQDISVFMGQEIRATGLRAVSAQAA